MQTTLEQPKLYRDLRYEMVRASLLLSRCHLCAHRCGVNRLAGEMGNCESLGRTNYFDAVLHYGDELELTPNYAVSFNGCNLRCSYCITAANSFHGGRGVPFHPEEFARRVEEHYQNGVDKLHLLGGEPAIHLLTILRLAQYVRPEVKIILNSNFYFAREVFELLSGLVTYYLPDLKYGNNGCAGRLSQVPRYWETVTQNILTARALGTVIVRHLLLPGHFDCCFLPVVEWVAKNCPETKFSLRGQFVPTLSSKRLSGMGRFLSEEEYSRALDAVYERRLNLVS